MKQIIISVALLLTGFAHSLPTTSTPFIDLKPETELAPLHSSSRSDLIQDSYIVVLKDHLNDIHLQDHALWITNLVKEASPFINWLHPKEDSYGIKHVYDTPSFKGYSGKFDKDMLQAIRTSEDVSFYLYFCIYIYMILFLNNNNNCNNNNGNQIIISCLFFLYHLYLLFIYLFNRLHM